jgi:prefoldin subunit 5
MYPLIDADKLAEVINFYKYYRSTLENELTSLQERCSELSKAKDK